MLNKGTAGQCTPGRRYSISKIAPYLTRTGALFFVYKNSNHKGDYSTEHYHKLK